MTEIEVSTTTRTITILSWMCHTQQEMDELVVREQQRFQRTFYNPMGMLIEEDCVIEEFSGTKNYQLMATITAARTANLLHYIRARQAERSKSCCPSA